MNFTRPFTSVTSPKGGIIIMLSTSRIFFEVSLFQRSPLTRRVFYSQQQQQLVWLDTTSSEGERRHHQHHILEHHLVNL